MLDRGFSGYVPYLFEEQPGLKEDFGGFVFYPNTVSFNGHTLMGAPPIYGGYEYTPLEMNRRKTTTLVDKHNEALLVLPRLFLEKGFSVTVTDPVMANHAWGLDLSIFEPYPKIKRGGILFNRKYLAWWKSTRSTARSEAAVETVLHYNLVRFSFFRAAPPLVRNFIYNHGRYLEVRIEDKIPPASLEAYAALDVLPEITGITSEPVNTYTSLYNTLPHEPLFFQVPGYDITEEVRHKGNGPVSGENHYHANMASFRLLARWFDFLKQNGAWDNTRIIIVSDHGLAEDKSDSRLYNITLPNGDFINQYTPLLLFKDFAARGPLRTDNTFMTNAETPLLALEGIVDDPVNPFTGGALKSAKEEGVFVSASHRFTPAEHGSSQFTIKDGEWLHVKDDVLTRSNWRKAVPGL